MKDAAFWEQLQQELPRRGLSPKATQRFEDTYRTLGVQKEAPARRPRYRGLKVAALTACLCCAMLFGVNAAFPAFAEGLPGVGRFFQAVNGAFSPIGQVKTPHGANVGTYDVQDVNVTAASGEYSMEIQDAFSDGQNLVFSIDVTADGAIWEKYDWLSVGSNLNGETTTLTINGETVDTTFSTGLERAGENHYVGGVSFALPQPAQDGQELNVEVTITQLTLPDKFTYEGYVYVDVDWEAAFTITADTGSNTSFQVSAAEAGVEILNVEASPTQTLITTNIPDWYDTNFQAILYTMDGTELRYSTPTEPRPADATSAVLTFDGAPAGTEQLVLRYYDDEKGEDKRDKVKAEFTIDLVSGTAAPSTTYDDGGALDLESPFHYQYLDSDSLPRVKNDSDFTNGLAIRRIQYAKEGSWEVSLLSNEAYREVLVEVYTAGGERIGSTVSEYGTNYGQQNWFWDENSPWWGGNQTPATTGAGGYPYYAYRLYLDGENTYLPAINETVTVVVKDNAAGEELLRQEALMNRHGFGGVETIG